MFKLIKNFNVDDNALQYATFNRRLIATSIDLVIILFFMLFIISPVNGWIYGDSLQNFSTELQSKAQQTDGEVQLNEVTDLIEKYSLYSKFFIVQLIGLIVFASFYFYFWIKCRETPGKWLTECSIVDAVTLTKPTKQQYILRFFGYILSSLPLCLGFFAIYWDKNNRAWHDRIAGTVVIVDKHEWKSLSEIKDIILSKVNFFKNSKDI